MERRRITEQRQHLLIIKRHRFGIQTGQILEHTYHRGIIVSEYIKFEQVMIDRVVIKMCRDNRRILVVCRMLHGCKRIDLPAKRQHDDPARMLSGRAADADASI